jgi:predicted aspartyl protease
VRRVLAIVGFLVAVCGPSAIASPEEHGNALPFRSSRPGEIVVHVTVNSAGPFPFLLDTGSSHTAISTSLAYELGATPVAKTVVTSPVGEDLRAVVRLDDVVLGPVRAQAVMASLVDDTALCREHRIRGLLGQDVLALNRYTIDFRDRLVIWNEPASRSDQIVTFRMMPSGGRYLVEVPQRDGLLRLVPDSGAEGVVLFDGRAGVPLTIVSRAGRRELSTLTERMTVEEIRLEQLQVGPHRWRDVPAVLLTRPNVAPNEGDGLLPLHLFDRVTIDAPSRLLIVAPSPSP